MDCFPHLDVVAGFSTRRLCSVAVLLVACFALTAPLSAQTVEAWQRAAVQRHPELAQAGSPLNQRFLAIVAEKRKSEPAFFTKTDWPVRAADLAAAAIQADAAAEAAKAKAAEAERTSKMSPDELEWDKQKDKWIFERLAFGDKDDTVAKKLYQSKLITARASQATRVDLGQRFRWVLGDAKYDMDFEMKDGLAAIVFNSQAEETGKANGFLKDDWEKLRATAIEKFGQPEKTAPYPSDAAIRAHGWKVTDTWTHQGAHIKLGVTDDDGRSSATLRISDPNRVAN